MASRESNRGSRGTSRRTVIGAGVAAGGFLLAGKASRVMADAGPAQTVRLKPQAARLLPTRLWGYNSPGTYDIPYEDPRFIPTLKTLAPHFLRFPGGTVGNYYNWHSGFMEVPDAGDAGSTYRKQLVHQAMPAVKKMHPEGVWVEDWDKIAKAVGADLVIEANLETSTPEEQAAWFADMASKGVEANFVELGTEFFIAMFDDMGRARFPDYATTIKLTKEFYDAIKPKLPKGAKTAVQSSGASFFRSSRPGPNDDITVRREWEWEDNLKPLPWFDAVTVHFYPAEVASAGMPLVKQLPGSTEQVFDAMLARADEGFDRGFKNLIARVPGKEIWLTEYGAFDPAQTFQGLPMHFNGLWLHQITREMMVMLRHPQITVSNYHALFFSGNLMSTFTRTPDGFKPINASGVQSWFFHASRGPGCSYQRMEVEGSRQVAANGTVPGEKYWDVEAGLFAKGAQRTLFIHNASKAPRRIDLTKIAGAGTTLSAEAIVTPDLLASLETATPAPQPVASAPTLEAPPYSLTKVTWSV